MRYTIALFILLFFYQGNAQSLLDSVVQTYAKVHDSVKVRAYLDIAASIQNKDYPNCLLLCEKVIALSQQQQNKHTEAEAYLLKGLTNYFAGEYDQTLSYYLKSIQLYESVQDWEGQAKVYNELGFFYRKQQDDAACIRSFDKAFEFANNLQNKDLVKLLYSNFNKNLIVVELTLVGTKHGS